MGDHQVGRRAELATSCSEAVAGHPEAHERGAFLVTALTRSQQEALALLGSRHVVDGACEQELWEVGVNMPRRTMRSLERRGLVREGDYLDDYSGYLWYLPSHEMQNGGEAS